MEYLTYIAKQGDRWDTIAWQFYGDPYLYEPNPPCKPSVYRLALSTTRCKIANSYHRS